MTAPPVDENHYMCRGSPKSPNTDVDQDYEETQAQPEATLQQTSIPSKSFKGSTEQDFYIIITSFCDRTTSAKIWLIYDPNNSRWVLEKLATESLSIGIAELFNGMLLTFDAKLCPSLECVCGPYKYNSPRLSRIDH